jgi:hypothetical protein
VARNATKTAAANADRFLNAFVADDLQAAWRIGTMRKSADGAGR